MTSSTALSSSSRDWYCPRCQSWLAPSRNPEPACPYCAQKFNWVPDWVWLFGPLLLALAAIIVITLALWLFSHPTPVTSGIGTALKTSLPQLD